MILGARFHREEQARRIAGSLAIEKEKAKFALVRLADSESLTQGSNGWIHVAQSAERRWSHKDAEWVKFTPSIKCTASSWAGSMAKSRSSCLSPSAALTLHGEKYKENETIVRNVNVGKAKAKAKLPQQNRSAHDDARLDVREFERGRRVMERKVVHDARVAVEQLVTDEPFLSDVK